MRQPVSDIAFTPAVKLVQERMGTRTRCARFEHDEEGGWQTTLNAWLRAFIAERDSFYLATASAGGQPYIQHRGGEPGFLCVLDERTLAFADYSGNGQYITVGNLAENPKAFIFLMDYLNRRRVKLWGEASVVENDAERLHLPTSADPRLRPERVIRFRIAAWDVNCQAHIPRKAGERDVLAATEAMRRRIAELETELARLGGLAPQRPEVELEA
ncbi:MAG: pyridoxamine 5'-phosphate oxidase family protein [Phycisphaerales bacterium]|nr:pyridoxamine 5'-phosphate oxidase family protein [Phycisphaerales bacterium]